MSLFPDEDVASCEAAWEQMAPIPKNFMRLMLWSVSDQQASIVQKNCDPDVETTSSPWKLIMLVQVENFTELKYIL
jgi:hypothetical protein